MNRLVDRYEQMTHNAVKPIADRFGLSIFPKVRVADVIDPDEVGATGDLKNYALKAHFDFVICRNSWDPVYAIEFDGASHQSARQRERDAKKDELCKRDNLPILRIHSEHLTTGYSHLTLLGWLVEVAEMKVAFDAEQEAGRISWEEDFDPFFLMSMEPGEPKFPYWISGLPRVRIERLHKRGLIHHPCGSGFFGLTDDKLYRGAELIAVTPTIGILVKGAMRDQNFPAPFGDLLSEILSVKLADRVERWVQSGEGGKPIESVYAEARDLMGGLQLRGSHSCGDVTDRWRL